MKKHTLRAKTARKNSGKTPGFAYKASTPARNLHIGDKARSTPRETRGIWELMGLGKTKAGKLLGSLSELSIAELDQHLIELGQAWTRTYAVRQVQAQMDGITTPPPDPPRVPGATSSSSASAGGADKVGPAGETVASLIEAYRSHERSGYHSLQYRTRTFYDGQIKRILDQCGGMKLAELNAETIETLYEAWASEGKKAMGHSLVSIFRILVNFGATVLEDKECERLSGAIRRVKSREIRTRKVFVTFEQAEAICREAHRQGKHSIALAQAFQFDCKLGQKEVVGDWVPLSEPGSSDIIFEDEKWLHGLRWSEIDDNLILTHTTNRGKELKIDLRSCPLVMAELSTIDPRPTSGPIIVADVPRRWDKSVRLPWLANEFRRHWRKIANACGIPSDVYNADTGTPDEAMAWARRSPQKKLNL